MKRKSFLMLLTGMFAISSGALVGCNDDDDVNKKEFPVGNTCVCY